MELVYKSIICIHRIIKIINGRVKKKIMPISSSVRVVWPLNNDGNIIIFDCVCIFTEWYWKCVFYCYSQKFFAIVAGIFSVLVVWSEVTFFSVYPTLSIFAVIVNVAKENYDYFTIEVILNFSLLSYFNYNIFSCCQQLLYCTCVIVPTLQFLKYEY